MTEEAKILLDILSGDNPSKELSNMRHSGALERLLPELVALDVSPETGQPNHKNNYQHTLMVLSNACSVSEDVWFRLAALLHDIGKAKTRKLVDDKWTFQLHEEVGAKMLFQIWKKFDLPKEHFDFVHCITAQHGQAKNVAESVTESAVRRFHKETHEHFDKLIDFCKCDITTRFEEKRKRYQEQLENLRKRAKEIEKADQEKMFRTAVTGDWLMTVTGLKPGFWIKPIKEEVERAVKAGEVANDESAKDYAIDILKLKVTSNK